MIELPVSGWTVSLRPLTGAHEALLLGAGALAEAETLIMFFGEVVGSGADRKWAELPISDGDALLLHVRRSVIGDSIDADIACQRPGCGARADISFSISEYLKHHQPRGFARYTAEEEGWRCMDGTRYRPPTLGDEAAAAASGDPEGVLRRRCFDGQDPSRDTARKIERALASIAPSLTSNLRACCPQCKQEIKPKFDPRLFVLRELTDQAAFLDADIHLLASTYHWSMQEILALPRARRIRFAERIRSDRIGGLL